MNEASEKSSSSSSSESSQVDSPTYAVEDVETHEGVDASDFEAYSTMVEVRLDAVVASSVVLVVAVFVCAGVLAVQTLLRSLEKW